jgi:hypothetical protein
MSTSVIDSGTVVSSIIAPPIVASPSEARTAVPTPVSTPVPTTLAPNLPATTPSAGMTYVEIRLRPRTDQLPLSDSASISTIAQDDSKRALLSVEDDAALRAAVAARLDLFDVEFGNDKPNIDRLLESVAIEERDAYRNMYQTLLEQTDRWRFPTPPIEQLTIRSLIPIDGDATRVRVSTYEVDNAIHLRIHDPFTSNDDEILASGLESITETQTWVKQEGVWRVTSDVDRQDFPGENRCANY